MKRRFFLAVVLTVITAVVAGCGDDAGGYLEIRGSDTMVNLGQHYAEAYMESHPDVSISVTGGGSGTGLAALINNTVDIAQSSRAIKQEELDQAQAQGVEVCEFIIGQDAISVIVNENNPLSGITIADLKKVFTGEITHWSQLGWEEGGAITLYSRQSNSGTYVFFWETVLDQEDWALDTMFLPGTSAIYEGIVADANGIGYVGVAYVREGVRALKLARDGASPYVDPLVRANIDSGLYPLARPLYFYINGIPEGAVLDFLKWVLAAEGVAVLEATGFYANTPAYNEQNAVTFRRLGVE